MSDDHLHNLRHSCAHLLAAAVLALFPHAKPAIGPAIENGFYYDFDFGDTPISESDLPFIENKMREIVAHWVSFDKREVSVSEAKKKFAGNPYKLELIDDLTRAGHVLTIYRSGDFEDLCRGGHIDKPAEKLFAFKLLSIAGAYWRGSEKNPMLTRIYGTAFATQEELDEYLSMLSEIAKRDHKKLGKELGLFVFSDLVGSGLPLWTPKGTLLRELLDAYVWELRRKHGYRKVTIPHLTKKDLYEASGHWVKFSDELFKIETREGHFFAVKPMNCPHHTQIFASQLRSYRDMPQRYAETTMVYRDEQSGELSGLSRVRSLTQDDAHVFCSFAQVQSEIEKIYDIIQVFYGTFGFALQPRLSTHDPSCMEKYLGDEQLWEKAESVLAAFLREKGLDYLDGVGEAAFYGPKIDFISQDALGRKWQVATIQLDFNMPSRFGLFFVNEQGARETPVMIHAAIMGSIERFLSVYIEHCAGAFPLWFAPLQVVLIPIADRHTSYAVSVSHDLDKAGIRYEMDDRDATMQAKIRDAQLQKVPYMFVIGDKEVSDGTVSVRLRSGENLGPISVSAAVDRLLDEIRLRV